MDTKFIFLVFCMFVKSSKQHQSCCDDNVLITFDDTCTDGKNISIKCTGYISMLNNNWSPYSHYAIVKNQTDDYLDAYNAGFMVRSTDFCIGTTFLRYANKSNTVAMVCAAKKVWYSGDENKYESPEKSLMTLFHNLVVIFNWLSGVCLFITAAIYFVLPVTQDVQGTCTFHFALSAGLAHLSIAYVFMTDRKALLPNMCITNIYAVVFLALVMLFWSGVLSFNTWRQSRASLTTNVKEDKLLMYYRVVGYGAPSILIFLTYIKVHVTSLVKDNRLENSCYDHQNQVVNSFIILPVIAVLSANIFFFVDSQQRISALQQLALKSMEPTPEVVKKALKFRIFLNGKLLIVMGIPWILYAIVHFMYEVTQSLTVSYIELFLQLFVSFEGALILIIMVISRKRVLKSILQTYSFTERLLPASWKQAKDWDTAQEPDTE